MSACRHTSRWQPRCGGAQACRIRHGESLITEACACYFCPLPNMRLGKRAWLHCDVCRHSVMIEPDEFARLHLTPLLTISNAMRCTICGERKGCCWLEPHDTRDR